MKCPHCGKEISDDNLFCGYCGTKIEKKKTKICPQCHQEIPHEAIFCNKCGYDLSQKKETKKVDNIHDDHETYSRVARKEQTKKGNNKNIIIIGVIVGVLAIVAIVWFFFLKPDDSKYDPDNNILKTEKKEEKKEKLELEEDEFELYVGEYDYIETNIDCTYKSEDNSIAKVDSFGTVTGVKEGKTKIQVKGEDGTTKTCKVTVKAEKQDTVNGDYVFPDSDTKILTEQDLQGKSAWELRVARNEIYARHGRKFTDESLSKYFEEKSWYKGTIESDAFDESVLSATEKQNAEFISAYEKAHPQ